jgi:hypothetical protein
VGRRLALKVAASVVAMVGLSERGAGADKSQYSLFNPTPRALMREMTTDRPDTTEVPFTVDAGHVQTESTVFGYSRSRPDSDGAVSDAYEFAYTNVRIGLTNDVELSLVWQPYGIVRTRQAEPDPLLRQEGIGSVDIRAKINLWGNDTFAKDGSALALLPILTVPTDDDNGIGVAAVEGGLVVPLALELPHGFGLGINTGVFAVQDEDATGHHAEYVATAALSYEWTDKFGTYTEVVGLFGVDDPRGDICVVGAGWTYALTDNAQLDGGVNFGLTAAADRYNPFVGLSMRF